MIEQLFGSKTRVKLLQLFYSNPNRSFYVREITRKIDEQINSVRRELANLLSIGLIVSDNTNNKLYYEVNQKYEYFAPLTAIFGGGIRPIAARSTIAAGAGAGTSVATSVAGTAGAGTATPAGTPGTITDVLPGAAATGASAVAPAANTKSAGPANQFSEDAAVKALGNVEIAVYTGQFTRDERSGVDVFLVGDINQSKLQKYMADLETREGKELRYTMLSLADFQYRMQIKDRFVSNIMQSKKQILVDKHNSLKA